MFTLKILFVGLIAFVDQSSTGGPFAALLVDARNPTAAQLAAGMHPHRAFLAFPMENWDYEAGGLKPDAIVANEYGEEIGMIWLDHEELSLLPVPNTPLTVVTGVGGGGSKPTNDEQAKDLIWAMKMNKLDHGDCRYGALCPGCLGLPVQDPLLARVRLDRGNVTVQRVGRARETADYHAFEFKPSPVVDFTHALAGKVQAVLEITGSEVEVATSSGRSLVLIRTEVAPEVHLVVGNLPLDSGAYKSYTWIDHFLWYYDLVSGINQACTDRPKPVVPDGGATSGSGVFCPQVQF